MKFEQLGLSQPILEALNSLSITDPTPIQLAAIPAALKGNDVVGLAQTGTGKTAAFSLPLLLEALQAWPRHCREARESVSEADLVAAQAGLF